MKIHEYQSKRIFEKYGVPIPAGDVATSPKEAYNIATDLGGKVIVKSQVLVGGRGKAGGVKLAQNAEEAEKLAGDILGMDIKGLTVRKVLIDEASNIKDEIYVGITNDREKRMPVMMVSAEGGVEIEEVARVTPEKIIKVHINPLLGLQGYQIRDIAASIELPRKNWKEFGVIANGLWKAYTGSDATLAEINPMIITDEETLLAVDGKMLIDDSALFRQKEIAEMRDLDTEVESEAIAREHDLAYIQLDGEIGCMVNGAGLAMTTMDIVTLFGGSAANFLDIGGGANAEKVSAAFRIILSDPNVKVVLINIFGGITRGDEVAKGILEAIEEVKPEVPMVVRLVGTNAEEGRALLADADMITAETLAEAAQKAVAVATKTVATAKEV